MSLLFYVIVSDLKMYRIQFRTNNKCVKIYLYSNTLYNINNGVGNI